LLYSNSQKEWLKKLNSEEIFLMNLHDEIILSILDIAIYESIINSNFETLCNSIFTYSRLRSLNRLHLPGVGWYCVESLILDDKVLLKNSFKGKIEIEQNDFNAQNYLFHNFLKVIFFNQNNWKKIVLKQYDDNINSTIKGKFDIELLHILKKIVLCDTDIETHYINLIKLYSKCQWLTQGYYRECKLIKYMPIFLIGIYKLIGREIKIETDMDFFDSFIIYLNNIGNTEPKLVYNFTGKIDFLNKILDKEYEGFSEYIKDVTVCKESANIHL
jgi:hypothetical protein